MNTSTHTTQPKPFTLPKLPAATLTAQWLQSYSKDSKHALRDAHRNLPGFTSWLRHYLESNSIDHAFKLAIKKSIG